MALREPRTLPKTHTKGGESERQKSESRSQKSDQIYHTQKEEMQMLKLSRMSQMTKILGAITMSALLLWATSGVQVVSQQAQLPRRSDIVHGLQNLVQTLTASEGDILDVENTIFTSFPVVTYFDDGTFQTTSSATLARIPLHPSSRSVQLLFDWLIKDEPFGEALSIGALYVSEDLVGCPNYDRLAAGIYHLKVLPDLRVIAVDIQGNEYFVGHFAKQKVKEKIQGLSLETAPPIGVVVVGGLTLIVLCLIPGEQLCTTTY